MKRWTAHVKLRARLAQLPPSDRWLSALAIACLGALTVELMAPHRLDSSVESPDDASASSADRQESWQVRPLEDYRAIAERPLFAFDRRPFVPPPAEPAPQQPAAPRVEFELSAVASSDSARMAFLKTSLSRTVVKLALNQTIEGWTLVEVRDNAVVLRNGAEERTVQLQSNRAREKRAGGAAALDARGHRQR